MTKMFLYSIAVLIIAGGFLVLKPGGRTDHLGSSISRPQEVLLSQIKELAELVTLRVPVSTVITTELAGYIGSVSCVVVVNGDVELGVDLELARFEKIDTEARTATLVLPRPTVHVARLDHELTRIYSVNRHGLWWIALGDEPGRRVVNLAMQQAQATVQAAGRDARLITQARERAERVLLEAFKALGWHLSIVWRR